MSEKNYNVIDARVPIKMWNKHVKIEPQAIEQLTQIASMPFVKPYVAAMPDTHLGMGATVGSVIPTQGAVMPAAVGVDIGCGMMAVRTNLKIQTYSTGAISLPIFEGSFQVAFDAISEAVPHGRSNNGGSGDIGAWSAENMPEEIKIVWRGLSNHEAFQDIFRRHPEALSKNAERHLGTLGTGNHFIEVAVEIGNPESNLWVILHSGSRGFGNRIGTYFTKLAGDLAKQWYINLPNRDLGYLPVGTKEYNDYILAVLLAQRYAWVNREIMMSRILGALGAGYDEREQIDGFNVTPNTIHMHHNYADVLKDGTILTRKGAVDASHGKWVIIPGSMGAKTYIARGLGSKDSFNSCSHGAGRAMSRTEALKTFTVEDHVKATEGVYCDKTEGVLDETPAAYKDIDAVMESQRDLVEPVLKLKQIISVKGVSD